MKAILMKVEQKDMEFIEKIMEVYFKVSGNVINNMEKVVKYGQMEQNMKVIMCQVKNMVEVHLFGLMDHIILEILLIIVWMDLENM